MSDIGLDDLLDGATPQSTDVSLSLDGELSAQRDALIREARGLSEQEDVRAGQKPRVVQIREELEELDQRMAERVLTLRITQMPGTEWSSLKAQHPMRDKNALDKSAGFNIEAVARKALVKYGARVTDAGTESVSAAQWQKIFDRISGGDLDSLMMSVLGLNQLNAQVTTERLLKLSRRIDGSDKK